MNIIEMIKTKKLAVAGSIAILAVILIVGIVTSMDSYASETYWDLKIGDKKIAVFNTEEEAQAVIDGVKKAYIQEGSEVLAVSCDPKITVEQSTYKVSEKPKFAKTEKVKDLILTGTEEKVEYKVKEDESLWNIAVDNGYSVEELIAMNPEKDPEMIFPGDVLCLYEMKPLVNVTTEQVIVSEKDIQFETEEKSTDKLYEDESEVEQQGVCGVEKVTEQVKTENGKVISSKVKSSEVIKEPVKEIILVGTKKHVSSTAFSGWSGSNGTTYSGNGGSIASFALQFVGCPYAYGGSSLTGGADCSGFVMSVFSNFGVGLPHNAIAMRYYGREVSLGEAMPGDIICNPGHVGIYIGGGQMVHAVNENLGIAVTSVEYVGPVVTVRRIVE